MNKANAEKFLKREFGLAAKGLKGPDLLILDGKWFVFTYDMIITELTRLSTIAESIFMTKKLRIPKISSAVAWSLVMETKTKKLAVLTSKILHFVIKLHTISCHKT